MARVKRSRVSWRPTGHCFPPLLFMAHMSHRHTSIHVSVAEVPDEGSYLPQSHSVADSNSLGWSWLPSWRASAGTSGLVVLADRSTDVCPVGVEVMNMEYRRTIFMGTSQSSIRLGTTGCWPLQD